jgi:hypothetical protein
MGRDVTRRDPATDFTARDPAPSDPARDDHPSRRALRHAMIIAYPMISDDVWVCLGVSPSIFFWFYVPSLLTFCPAVRWCGCPVVRRPGGLIMFSYVRLCPVMSGYVRLSPLMRGDARSLRLPGRFGTMCRAESGPTDFVLMCKNISIDIHTHIYIGTILI